LRPSLTCATVDELLALYIELSIEQANALELSLSSSKVNRIGERIFDINDELERRPGDQWRELTKLFDHPNAWVRFNAATAIIKFEKAEARQVIQKIADSKYPISGHAGMFLATYDGELSHLLRR
jgi:HEAT repeat protein